MKPKVFCIGLNKTATTSLHFALKSLGMKSLHNSELAKSKIAEARSRGEKLLQHIDSYDVYSDVPFCDIYKELDREYPQSKFIMTTRDDETWVKSLQKHRLRHGKLPTKRKSLLDRKRNTEAEIRTYFRGREDFLEIDICAGEGWDKIAPFLGIEKPGAPFPHRNKGKFFLRLLARIKRKILYIEKEDPLQ